MKLDEEMVGEIVRVTFEDNGNSKDMIFERRIGDSLSFVSGMVQSGEIISYQIKGGFFKDMGIEGVSFRRRDAIRVRYAPSNETPIYSNAKRMIMEATTQ